MTFLKCLGAIAVGFVVPAFAQHVISAKSGMVHYTEGEVFLGDTPVQQKLGDYPEIKPGQHLRTTEGRAEVLLTPGVFLRLAENSEVAMLANKLTDTKIDVVSGSVMVEAGEVTKENSIELTVNGVVLEIRKRGLFRIDAGTPPRVRVYDGEVSVADAARPIVVKEGRQALITSVPVLEKFSKDDSDAFHRWAGRRSGYLAMANMSAARQVRDNGIPWQVGGWYYSPYFGMFTYIPLRGSYRNYWNYAYHSPSTIYVPPPAQTMPRPDMWGGMSASSRGVSDMSGRSYGGSQGTYQAPATASPAPAAGGGGGRSADSGSSRGGSGGSR